MVSSSTANISRKRPPKDETEMLVAIRIRNTPWLRARLHYDEEAWNPRSFWVPGTIPPSELSIDLEETDFLNRAFAVPIHEGEKVTFVPKERVPGLYDEE
jgi:hypothetical protein